MRALIALTCAFSLCACGSTKLPIQLASSPPKFAVEQFRGQNDPGAWAPGASDNAIAANRREASSVIKSLQGSLKTLCFALSANSQVVGVCGELP